MDTVSTLKTVGQVAGIGGVALGVLMIIFREVIRKSIFPRLAQVQAYRLIRLIVVLTFSIALSGLAAWVYVQRYPIEPIVAAFPSISPQPAIDSYLAAVDGSQFDEAHSQLSTIAKGRFDLGLIRSSYETVRIPLGGVKKRETVGHSPYERAPDGTLGPFLNVIIRTKFDRGMYAELMTLQAEGDQWRIAGHYIVPCQLPVCDPGKE
jgi:hypothetical protein